MISQGPPPVLPPIAQHFLQALRAEYIGGVGGAVGNFLDKMPQSVRQTLYQYEDMIRRSDQPPVAINQLASAWGLPTQSGNPLQPDYVARYLPPPSFGGRIPPQMGYVSNCPPQLGQDSFPAGSGYSDYPPKLGYVTNPQQQLGYSGGAVAGAAAAAGAAGLVAGGLLAYEMGQEGDDGGDTGGDEVGDGDNRGDDGGDTGGAEF